MKTFDDSEAILRRLIREALTKSDKAEIERLITTDIFGKSSTIIFSNVNTNSLVKDSEFIPVIPEGVEYIEN